MPVADGIALAEEPWNINHIRLASEEYVKPSDLLESKEWVEYIVELFELHQLRASNEIDDEMKSKADYTVKLLYGKDSENLLSRGKFHRQNKITGCSSLPERIYLLLQPLWF